eukprot:TRINITY_DN2554_c1_g1_i2.p1 TRINITY_DN2554_c1_g1~~TRINITY_DN2554_c1_g1_i2.p1  ORF type:complete len:884 (+),score=280.92 TRINITY_DN2554_c1_g1_i2:99-2750(+)
MGESILNLPEKLEAQMGVAIEQRNTTIAKYVGPGLPDLVVLMKDYSPPKMLIPGIIKAQKFSYYHWTQGIDVSSSAAIAAYFGALLESQEKQNFGRGTFKIEKCVYCSYNAFRRRDLRVEIKVPDNPHTKHGFEIQVYSVDVNNYRHDIDELFWKETYISAMLRCISGPLPSLRPLRVRDPFMNPQTETNFLAMCADQYFEAKKLGPEEGDPNKTIQLPGIVDSSNNMMCSLLCHHFLRHQRFNDMSTFFENFLQADPVASVAMAQANTLSDNHAKAFRLLEAAIERRVDNSSLMLAMAELSLKNLPNGADRHNRLLEILQMTMKATANQYTLSKGWWIMALTLICMGRNEWALVIMNNAPCIPEEYSKRNQVDRIGFPPFSKITQPPTPPVVDLSVILQDEDISFVEEAGDESLKNLSAANLSDDEKSVYTLLSDIIGRSSWEHLTKIRKRVLVRPADLEKSDKRAKKLADTKAQEEINAQKKKEEMAKKQQPQPRLNPFDSDTSILSPAPPKTFPVDSEINTSTNPFDETDQNNNTNNNSNNNKHNNNNQKQPKQPNPFDDDEDEISSTIDMIKSENSLAESLTIEKEMIRNTPNPLRKTRPIVVPIVLPGSSDDQIVSSSLKNVDLNSTSCDVSVEDLSEHEEIETPQPIRNVRAAERTNNLDGALRDNNVDDALTDFLLSQQAKKLGISIHEVPTTPLNNEASSSPSIPVIEISRNVDMAFHAIFQDIKAFHAWKEEERRLGFTDIEDLVIKPTPQRTVADWLRIAQMCERLNFTRDAYRIYKALENQHIRGLTSMVRFDAERGDIKSTIIDSSNLIEKYQEKYHTSQPHPEVISSILKLMSGYGLHKIRAMQTSMQSNPLLSEIILDAVRWRSKGFDC